MSNLKPTQISSSFSKGFWRHELEVSFRLAFDHTVNVVTESEKVVPGVSMRILVDEGETKVIEDRNLSVLVGNRHERRFLIEGIECLVLLQGVVGFYRISVYVGDEMVADSGYA